MLRARPAGATGVQISIGSEHGDRLPGGLTLVTASYQAGALSGVIGVIGPTPAIGSADTGAIAVRDGAAGSTIRGANVRVTLGRAAMPANSVECEGKGEAAGGSGSIDASECDPKCSTAAASAGRCRQLASGWLSNASNIAWISSAGAAAGRSGIASAIVDNSLPAG